MQTSKLLRFGLGESFKCSTIKDPLSIYPNSSSFTAVCPGWDTCIIKSTTSYLSGTLSLLLTCLVVVLVLFRMTATTHLQRIMKTPLQFSLDFI